MEESLWRDAWDGDARLVPQNSPIQSAPAAGASPPVVTSASSNEQKLALFKSLFAGRTDAYAESYFSKKRQRLEYAPACLNKWKKPLCKKPDVPCSKCRNRKLAPLADEVLLDHLKGKRTDCSDVVGVYPLFDDDMTNFLAADFDGEGWREEARSYVHACANLGLPAYLERSRSGDGGHAWIFFAKPLKAWKARSLGLKAISLAMERYHPLPFSAYDRLFPNQDVIPQGGFGNLIALPLQRRAVMQGNSVFVDERCEPYPDQWQFLSTVERVSAESASRLVPNRSDDALGSLMSLDDEQKPWEMRHQLPLANFGASTSVSVVSSNMLYLDKEGLDPMAVNAIRRLAAFANPDYHRALAMRQSVRAIPRIIYAGIDSERYIGLPRGCEGALLKLASENGLAVEVEDKRSTGRAIAATFNGELRAEQRQAALSMLPFENGILSAATGFGKTIIAAYLIAQRKTSTLILVPSKTLLEQWIERLQTFLAIDEELPELLTKTGRKSRKERSVIGQIGGGKNLPSGIVDVAIPASLFEKGDVAGERRVRDIVREYGMVICDECHHVPSLRYEQVVRHACATYVYGMSATPMRKDELEPLMFMQCGPIRHRFGGKDQMALQSFSRILVPRFTKFRLAECTREDPQAEDGKKPSAPTFNALIEAACADGDRNALIVDDAASLVGEGRTPLVLTRRIQHASALHAALAARSVESMLLVGSDDPTTRAEKMVTLRNHADDVPFVVVATGEYLGEGFDDDRFDALLLATPVAWKGLVVQYAGRLHRERAGKHDVRIYDYADVHIPPFDGMYRKRLKEYAALGYEVQVPEDASVPSAFYGGSGCQQQFIADVEGAQRSVLIQSVYAHPKRIDLLRPAFAAAIARGVRIEVSVDAVPTESRHFPDFQESLRKLAECGCIVAKGTAKQPNLSVIDERIVWYGETNFCSFNKADAQSLRFESASVAHDLLHEDKAREA